MSNKTNYFITAIGAILLLISPAIAEDWALEEDKNSIKVYTRPLAGSPIKEFKAITIIDKNYLVIDAVFNNTSRLTNWMHDSVSITLLDITKNNSESYLYNIMSMPIGISYRYVVIKMTRTKEENRIIRDMQGIQNSELTTKGLANLNLFESQLPVSKNGSVLTKSSKDSMIRMSLLSGEWIIEKISENQSRVTYIIRTNPSGSIPSSIANKGARHIPFETLRALKRELGCN